MICAAQLRSRHSLPQCRQAELRLVSTAVHPKGLRCASCRRLRYLSRRTCDLGSQRFLLCRVPHSLQGVAFEESPQWFLLERRPSAPCGGFYRTSERQIEDCAQPLSKYCQRTRSVVVPRVACMFLLFE